MADKKNLLEEAGFTEEVAEEHNVAVYGAYVKTGYPQPVRRYRLIYESQQASIEHTYFWMYNHTKLDMGFGDVIKTVDTFAASENSSFWGLTEQRKSIQQDQASKYLGTIAGMVKSLFQIVREIRMLDERIVLYKGAVSGRQADDYALKGYWVDFVQGGGKGQANIYTMAQQLGFVTLPDLFFKVYVKDQAGVDAAVDSGAKEFNDKVKEVLRRILASYMAWREESYKEIATKRTFTLRYLRQHWAVMRMYMSWVKPYLRNVQKLQSPDKYDKNPELISSFEGALIEIEYLAKKPVGKTKNKEGKEIPVYAVLLGSFNYRVKPQMAFAAERNQGAVHVGRVEATLRCYGWSEEDIEAYIKFREAETLELISMVDTSVKEAMEALGDDLMKYLKESGMEVTFEKKEEKKDEKKKNEPTESMFAPFKDLYYGLKEMATLPFGEIFTVKQEEKKKGGRGEGDDYKNAQKAAAGGGFQVFKNYKKAHQMPAW